jgi:hypothetical protein
VAYILTTFLLKTKRTMIDIDYLHFLENILTDNRREVLKSIAKAEPIILPLPSDI